MILGDPDSSQNGSRPSSSLDVARAKLRRLSASLRLAGGWIGALVLFQVGTALFTMRVRASPMAVGPSAHYLELATASGFGACLILILAVVLFDQLRRTGEDLFAEISDELQSKGPAPLEVRLELRAFARASEPPLLPSRSGLFAYAAVSLALMLFQVWLVYGRILL